MTPFPMACFRTVPGTRFWHLSRAKPPSLALEVFPSHSSSANAAAASRPERTVPLIRTSDRRYLSYCGTNIRAFSSAFDPYSNLSQSIKVLLKQPEEELSSKERKLTKALKDLRSDPTSRFLMQDLRRAYEDLEYWQEALRIEEMVCDQIYDDGDGDAYADSIHTQGKLQLRQLKFRESWDLYQKALEWFQQSSDKVQHGHVLMSLSGWYYFRGDPEESLRLLLESEPMLEQHPTLLIKNLNNQGRMYQETEDFDSALDKYRQAVELVPKTSSSSKPEDDLYGSFDDLRRIIQMNTAEVLSELKRREEALAQYQAILEANEGDHAVAGKVLLRIGTLYAEVGDHETSLSCFTSALQHLELEVDTNEGSFHGEGKKEAHESVRTDIIQTYLSMGAVSASRPESYEDAKEFFQRALIIAQKFPTTPNPSDDPMVKYALHNLDTLEKKRKEEETGQSDG